MENPILNEKAAVQISKFLSQVLRHRPEKIGIRLDKNGWAAVEDLIEKSRQAGMALTFEKLKFVVETNSKSRFAFNEDFSKIRASQGHSVEVDLDYEPQVPPTILFHGTAEQSVPSILKTGLDKRRRHHVHLSADVQTARQVGGRHGKPVIFEVAAMRMQEAGFKFFRSENGVWLVDAVPLEFLKIKN